MNFTEFIFCTCSNSRQCLRAYNVPCEQKQRPEILFLDFLENALFCIKFGSQPN